MTAYEVQVTTIASGRKRRVTIYAERREFVERIVQRSAGEHVTKVASAGFVDQLYGRWRGSRQASMGELAEFYSTLETFFEVAQDTRRAFESSARIVASHRIRNALCRIVDGISAGENIAVVLDQFQGALPESHIEALKAGAKVGSINQVIARLAKDAEHSDEQGREIKKAIYYPATLLVMASVLVTGVILFQIPAMVKNYQDFGTKATGDVAVIFSIAKVVSDHVWWGLLIPVAVAYGVFKFPTWIHTPRGQQALSLWPALRRLIFKVSMSRCLNTYALLRTANVDIKESLEITSRQTRLPNVRQFFVNCREAIAGARARGFFAAAMLNSDLLGLDGARFIALLQAGEESGSTETVATRVANSYSKDADMSMKLLSVLIEPALIFVCAVVIGLTVLISIYPALALNASIVPAATGQ